MTCSSFERLAIYIWSQNATSVTLVARLFLTMASRRAQPTKTKPMAEDPISENEADEFNFLASQNSSGSDDHACAFCTFFLYNAAMVLICICGDVHFTGSKWPWKNNMLVECIVRLSGRLFTDRPASEEEG